MIKTADNSAKNQNKQKFTLNKHTNTSRLCLFKLQAETHQREIATHLFESQLISLAILLSLLQVLDGILTTQGVSIYGFESEANLLIRNMMFVYGAVPSLILVKITAIGVIFSLLFIGLRVRWLKPAFLAIGVYYIILAIVPWTILLIRHFIPYIS
ncbi:MAG TPA: hypothetical protein PKD37_03810 [Oligoflexia bacterium]|nr:hypothetical protein [Oligoflexia bacterium]HMP27093.1 hypothetical protein [Oligoflexia bacterium]